MMAAEVAQALLMALVAALVVTLGMVDLAQVAQAVAVEQVQ